MARKPASRGASRAPRKPARQVPAWVWVFTGVVSGAFLMFLYHLATLRDQAPDVAAATAAAEPRQSAAQADSGPHFDFYAVLPKMEVIVPKGDDEPAQPRRQTAPAENDDSATPAPATASRHEQYLLQAGSFRRNEDADRRRGELILHGLSARIQPVSMGNGDTWYRVMVGPFDSANAAHRAQDKLTGVGIETLAIRARTD